MRNMRQGLLAVSAISLAAAFLAGCGSFDTKEEVSTIHQSFECMGATQCTEAESYSNLSCYDTKLGITLVCYECVIVEAKAVGMFDNPTCNPQPPDGGTDAGPDVTPDAAPDVQPDTTPDATPDAPDDVVDAAPDVTPDAQPDADAAPEADAPVCECTPNGISEPCNEGTGIHYCNQYCMWDQCLPLPVDAGPDTTDAAPDATPDAPDDVVDAAPDVQPDTTPDAPDDVVDAAPDVTPDAQPDADAAPEADAETCAEQLGAPCLTALAYGCNNTLRCSCTGMWSDPATTNLYVCSCHGGELCSLYGWTEGYTCSEPIPNGDGAAWTLQCQCGVMLQQGSGVVCTVPDAATDAPVDGAGGSGGSGGSGGTGGSAGTGGSGGSLTNPQTLPEGACVQSSEATSPATLPTTGLWLQYTAPSHGTGTYVAEYDWTDFFVPGNTDTNWQIRTVAPSTAANTIFVSMRDDTSYARFFQPKVVVPETLSDCHLFNNDGYFCTSTTDDALKNSVYCLGTWDLWRDNVKVTTLTDAPNTVPAAPWLKTIQKVDGFWSAKIGYQHP